MYKQNMQIPFYTDVTTVMWVVSVCTGTCGTSADT